MNSWCSRCRKTSSDINQAWTLCTLIPLSANSSYVQYVRRMKWSCSCFTCCLIVCLSSSAEDNWGRWIIDFQHRTMTNTAWRGEKAWFQLFAHALVRSGIHMACKETHSIVLIQWPIWSYKQLICPLLRHTKCRPDFHSSGGFRGCICTPLLLLVLYICVHSCTSPSNDSATVACSTMTVQHIWPE